MGCCPCWKSSGLKILSLLQFVTLSIDSTNEYTPIARGGETSRHTPEVAQQPVETNSPQYYQSVIDLAQK
jgi:hypothetical protein